MLASTTDTERITALEHAVFGLAGDNGLLAEMAQLRATLGRLYFAIVGAALSFGFGSVAVCVAVVATSR